MSLPNVRFWERAVGDPEKQIFYRQHLHTSLSRSSSSITADSFWGVSKGTTTLGCLSSQQRSWPSWGSWSLLMGSARSEQTTLIALMALLYYFTSWTVFLCHICLRRHNMPGVCSGCELGFRFPWAQQFSSVLVLPDHGAVFLLDDFMDDFITDEGESCLLFEHKGTIHPFCEGWSTTVNKVAACGSNN